MLFLLGSHPPCLLFKQLFLERMPDDIRTQLVVGKHESCRAMAKQADLLWSAKEVATTNALEVPLEANSSLFQEDDINHPTYLQIKILFSSLEMRKGSQEMSKPLCVASKRPGQPQVMAAVADLKDCLVFVLDKVTKRCFLVVVPMTGVEIRTVKSEPFLLAANSSKIQSFGTKKLTLHFNSGIYHWEFVVAQVSKPLLGADFLRANKLLVDMANR